MTTIVVVKKNGQAVIGADTLITYGDQLEPAALIRNHSKLIRVGDTWLAVTGHAALDLVLRRLLRGGEPDNKQIDPAFGNVDQIFATFLAIHGRMKEDFFLKPDEDKEDEFESMYMNVLVANARGIFGVCSKRSVFEYNRFYAFGSGDQYALGAMQAVYASRDNAEDIALAGLEAAVTFDSNSAAPLELKTVALTAES